MKIKSPLLSFSASGSIANLITFLNIRGSTYAKTKQGKIGGTSAAQLLQRAKFKAACDASRLLTDEEKLYYHNLDIRSAACSWFNNFMSTFLLEEEAPPEAMIDSIQHVRFEIKDAATTDIIGIDDVDLARAVIFISSHTWVSPYSSSIATRVSFSDSTHVLAERYYGAAGQHSFVDCSIIQFNIGAIKSIQYRSFLFPAAVDSHLFSIDAVDLNKSIVLSQGCFMEVIGDLQECFFSFLFDGDDGVYVTRTCKLRPVSCYFLVLEFE